MNLHTRSRQIDSCATLVVIITMFSDSAYVSQTACSNIINHV